jgi:tRNA G37 N-methylase Trm5
VGARWGYYSFPAAELGADVFAFEKIPEQVACLKKTKQHNSFDNVTIVEGMAADDYSLDEFPTPDLAVIDVEGREYELLKNAPLLLESELTLIIELHGGSMSADKKMGKSPEAVKELLKKSGFTLSVLERRGKEHYHILAEKDKDISTTIEV